MLAWPMSSLALETFDLEVGEGAVARATCVWGRLRRREKEGCSQGCSLVL
jgi:hypothetical protein